MYKVVRYFTDLQDNDHEYNVGDTFPRIGLEVTDERLAELASVENKQGVVLIEKVAEETPVAAEEAEVVKKATEQVDDKPSTKKPRKKKETE